MGDLEKDVLRYNLGKENLYDYNKKEKRQNESIEDYEKDVLNYNLQTQKRDRIKESAIWIGLGMVFGFLLLFVLYMQISDARLKYTGKSIEASYTISFNHDYYINGNTQNKGISYTGEDGVARICKNVDPLSTHNGDKITLYYLGDNIDDARPLTILWFWVGCDLFFGGLLILCIYKVYKGTKITQHYKGDRLN